MERTVVLYPGLGVGHLVPMVELAKMFLQHGLAVTVALIKPPSEAPNFSATVDRIAASNPSITFHVLPPPPEPAVSGSDATSDHRIVRMFKFLNAMNAPLRDFLRSLPSVHALIVDMFCGDALDVAAELRLPAYTSFASAASDLAVFLYLRSMQDSIKTSFRELSDTIIRVPGVPPFKASELPVDVIDDEEPSRFLLRMFGRIPESRGILVNTFDSLEARALRALREGLCDPGRATPPVYFVGPLVSGGDGDKDHECLRWLDAQLDSSVVFVSFGSLGTFSKKQLEEIAVGLQKSEQRFLWVVRSPPPIEKNFVEQLAEADLDALLPAGFAEATKGRGLVVKSWAPQVEVLRHRATGAFVTHCGWNSTLEGITAGQPLLCWPLYAEQKLNKVFIVEEMKLGVEMRGYDEDVVTVEEVEAKIRWVTESEGCVALRQRVAAGKDAAAEALKEGGSSRMAFVKFLEDLEISKDMTRIRFFAQIGDLEKRLEAAQEEAQRYRDCGEKVLLELDEEAPPAGESSRDFLCRLAEAPKRLRAALEAAAQDAASLVFARCWAFYPKANVALLASGWPKETKPESVADRIAEVEGPAEIIAKDLGL